MTNTDTDKPPRLDDAQIISEFLTNRRVIDLRKYYTDKTSGQLRPTRKGLTLSLTKLPDLAQGINKACAVASDLMGKGARP